MNIITLAVVVSVVFLGIAGAIALSRWGAGGVAACSACTAMMSLVFLPVLLVQSSLTLVAALICAACGLKARWVMLASIGAMAASYGLTYWLSGVEDLRFVDLRERFPLESVAHRLDYEAKATGLEATTIPLSSHVERRLSQFEGRSSSNARTNLLSSLHHHSRDQFVLASGFGNTRMRYVIERNVELPDAEPVSLPRSPAEYSTSSTVTEPANPADLLAMHSSGLEDFLAPERIGYVKDRDHVAGFEPHRFSKLPALPSWNQTKTDFQLVRLELVSLLKHEVPVAYVSEHLPQMDELRDAPTRPLDDFERHALDQIRSEEDLVIDDAPNRIRMVGSLRAGKDCMECHSVRRGELLGAFSYELIGGRPVKERVEPGA